VLAKRSLSPPADVGTSQGALHLATAFPRPVWLDHLLPLLELEEIVTLRATCNALRAIVADMRADLGEQPVKHLKAMLTCFPNAESVEVVDDYSLTRAEQDRLIAWLKERGHSLTRIQHGGFLGLFLRRAYRAGALKTVKEVGLLLGGEGHVDLIIQGVVSGVESIRLELTDEVLLSERAALGYLRHFPALKEIECRMGRKDAALPPFIPPSLEALTLDCSRMDVLIEPSPALVLGCLPPMVESSGAQLRRLTLVLDNLHEQRTARGVRSLLQACASTLREVEVVVRSCFESAKPAAGLASCPHLERLTTSISTFAVMPPEFSVTFPIVHLGLVIDICDNPSLVELRTVGADGTGRLPEPHVCQARFPHMGHDGDEVGPCHDGGVRGGRGHAQGPDAQARAS
jgi:hypothetical protein